MAVEMMEFYHQYCWVSFNLYRLTAMNDTNLKRIVEV